MEKEILDEQHWVMPDYRQRMMASDWKQLLLNNDDKVIFRGLITKLKAKNLGYGVVEVYKLKPAGSEGEE